MADDVEFMDRKQLKTEVRSLRTQLESVKQTIQEWTDKQGHERCWYYPDLFLRLANLVRIEPTKKPCLPPREEFEGGCSRYQDEEYGCSKGPFKRGDRVRVKATGEVYDFVEYGYTWDYRHKEAEPDCVWLDDSGMYFIRFLMKDVEKAVEEDSLIDESQLRAQQDWDGLADKVVGAEE